MNDKRKMNILNKTNYIVFIIDSKASYASNVSMSNCTKCVKLNV